MIYEENTDFLDLKDLGFKTHHFLLGDAFERDRLNISPHLIKEAAGLDQVSKFQGGEEDHAA